ncbi:uncharacterized protein EDB91DRAFT_1081845 [Suillus paluster]|uniref:uncharacterized protein n=1 Tax=Suillus paluster TaxID=48578 RepID=UPI001B85B9DA|nr:uncharacterized protein EDB91DRAFT_1081845 [Suillus paluster]KAG1740747.1 hypothetical protein EDB91DRAFT_1081845 [Suillus paluster]
MSSGVQQTEASGKSNNPSFHAINIGNYCHFCCDHVQQPYCHECVDCSGIMCQQSIPWGSDCLCYGMVDTTKDFCCPICARTTANEDAPLPYTVLAYWIWKKVKMTWPMAILFVKDLHMHGGAHVSQSRKLAEGVSFMKCNIEAGFPPNTFIIMDTHSDEYSGILQHTGGHTGSTNTTITGIVTAYLGEEFLKGTANTSLAARSDETVVTTKTGEEPWCKLTPNARGGRRVLMLCGMFGATDVWVSFWDLIAANQGILDCTTTVLVYTTTTEGKQNVECCQIAKNSPGCHAFGAKYRSCGTAGCNLSATNIHVYNCSTGESTVLEVQLDICVGQIISITWEKEGKGKGGKGNGKKRCHAVMDEHMMEDEVNPIAIDIDTMHVHRK